MFEREPRYTEADIADIRQKAKSSELLIPTPEQVEFRKKIFDEIDTATLGSGVVPKLLELNERLSGEPHQAIIFDAVEISVGSPFPVPTRYIIPLTEDDMKRWVADEEVDEEKFEKEITDIKIPDFLPGLVVRRWPAGMTSIQIGIDIKVDAAKVYQRIKTLSHHWREGNSFAKPYWWSYESTAQDLTQEYDLMLPMNLNVALIYNDDMEYGLEYFTVGGHDYGSQVESVYYSTKVTKGDMPNIVWLEPDNQLKATKGFQYLESFPDFYRDNS